VWEYTSSKTGKLNRQVSNMFGIIYRADAQHVNCESSRNHYLRALTLGFPAD
jgi:hypothetical protein